MLGKCAAPLWLTLLLQYCLTIASLVSAGTQGEQELADIALAGTAGGITGYAVYQGMLFGFTRFSIRRAQYVPGYAVRGSIWIGKQDSCGLHLQRMMWFLGLVPVPIVIAWCFAEPILNAIIPEPELAVLAGRCLRIVAIGAHIYRIDLRAPHLCASQRSLELSSCLVSNNRIWAE
ncbi:hypothetical protein C7212DRAFT_341196 [Tuber magnatum]|uniref:RDD domain-containing protein n=1 Tax=Tuber magnatum TaxID=42249 RepID=A0A317T034_9PEZI|nr:hypothetical protein C7212DRAFT_341196 [Tuber magnatum]